MNYKRAVHQEGMVVASIDASREISRWLDVADKLLDSKAISDHKLAIKILSGLTQVGLDITQTKPSRRALVRKLHGVWCGMKSRCNYQSHLQYPQYGGRGIKVCPQWMQFSMFHEWALANGYRNGVVIHREDNDKGYSPDNAVWVTQKEHIRLHKEMRRTNAAH